jgi:ATP-dependent Lon protease
MTGELTLRGRVLPIGGLKEKLLAAHRGGLRTVLIPRDNERELSEIPDNIKRGVTIVPVTTVDEVLKNALVSELTPIDWDEQAELEASALTPAQGDEEEVGGVITH